jgi:hypothetical protein
VHVTTGRGKNVDVDVDVDVVVDGLKAFLFRDIKRS